MEKIVLSIFIIAGGILLRIVPHTANFAPVSALALFSGAKLNKKSAILVPLIAMAVSDYLLLYVNPFSNQFFDFSHIRPVTAMFHSATLYVWGSFVISGLIGIGIKKNEKPSLIVLASFAASVQFFVITNFGVWAGGMYDRSLNGLFQSYLMGLPFFKWTMLGDLFYSGAFFGLYEMANRIAQRSKPAIRKI